VGDGKAMHLPAAPPDRQAILNEIGHLKFFEQVLPQVTGVTDSTGRYLHWDDLRYKKPIPGGLTREEWWAGLRFQRESRAKEIPLECKDGVSFSYNLPDSILESLHEIDQRAAGTIQMPDEITSPEMKDRYYVSSLIEESITSSVLEGAATTRKAAQELLRTGRKPKDQSERMIVNNFRTMKLIESLRGEKLSSDLIMELHRSITEKTLDSPEEVGRFRRAEERIVVEDMYGHVYHVPPPAEDLEKRIEAMCRFANGESPDFFVHPVLRAIILHFWLAYDHPFTDGNGRTARALFYWSMLRHSYWLFEFISISSVILDAPRSYGRAFLYAENDENDLTYFLVYHLEIIKKAIKSLHRHIERKANEVRHLESLLRGVVDLNYRQRVMLGHALRHPHQYYTIRSHQTSHDVVYQTARTDLQDLANRGLLLSRKIGRTWHYRAVPHLERALKNLS